MSNVAYIAALGAVGCVSRYTLSCWIHKVCGIAFPYGTLSVNLIGAFLIGLIVEFSMRSNLVSPSLRIALAVGLLGGFTTFSTFSLETIGLLQGGRFFFALANAFLNVAGCLTCTWLGMVIARAI